MTYSEARQLGLGVLGDLKLAGNVELCDQIWNRVLQKSQSVPVEVHTPLGPIEIAFYPRFKLLGSLEWSHLIDLALRQMALEAVSA